MDESTTGVTTLDGLTLMPGDVAATSVGKWTNVGRAEFLSSVNSCLELGISNKIKFGPHTRSEDSIIGVCRGWGWCFWSWLGIFNLRSLKKSSTQNNIITESCVELINEFNRNVRNLGRKPTTESMQQEYSKCSMNPRKNDTINAPPPKRLAGVELKILPFSIASIFSKGDNESAVTVGV